MSKRLAGRYGYPADDPFRVTLHPSQLDEPLHWRKPRRVFVCSMGDLFHEDVPGDFIHAIMKVICKCRRHTFMILTKRPRRMKSLLAEYLWLRHVPSAPVVPLWTGDLDERAYYADHAGAPPDNLWLGASIENQQTADARIPLLLQTPAAVRFVSYEPALGPVNIRGYMIPAKPCQGHRALPERPCLCGDDGYFPTLDQVICGAETGPGARPMDLDWARSLRDQCAEAGVSFFFKRDSAGNRKLDGKMHENYPGE